jgi:hypothetical protein
MAAAQPVWVAGPPGDDCGGAELVAELGRVRPGLSVRSGLAPDGSADRQVMLERFGGTFTVVISGGGAGGPLFRTFADPQDCPAAGRTAALIVDSALDQLRPVGAAPSLEPFIPRRWLQLAAAIGGGVEQGLLGWSPALEAEGLVHLGAGEILLALDLIPTASTLVDPKAALGAYAATSFGVEVGGGLAPRVGPGRIAADVLYGWDTAFVSLTGVATGEPFYQQQGRTVAEPFFALRVGYSLDLPHGLFIGLRAEEQLALVRDTLALEGTDYSITTRAWSFDAAALLGWRFF